MRAPPRLPPITLRLAESGDLPALGTLIPTATRALSQGFYTTRQIESAISYVFGPDTQLITDRTYFVATAPDGTIVGCGGWSRRRTLYGGDQAKTGPDPLLDPATDAARIRAFFVHPDWARQGIGGRLIADCADAARAEGFRRLELVATLPGEPLYRAFGFTAIGRLDTVLPDGTHIPFVHMARDSAWPGDRT